MPDGEFKSVSDDSDPELIWALRGGGHNLGVVTEFTFNYEYIPNHNWNYILFTNNASSPKNAAEILRIYEH